jgi:hypothetical protein
MRSDYLIDGVSGILGGVLGFCSTMYATASFLALTKTGGENFSGEVGYIMGYTLGIPFGATSFIHFNPFNKCRNKKSYISSLKYSLIGVQIGLGLLIIASNISSDTKYWTGFSVLILPIAGSIIGYHTSQYHVQTGLERIPFMDFCQYGQVPKIKIIEVRLK